jgi:hypothetical protein
MINDSASQVGEIESVAEWEGQAIPAPGVLFKEPDGNSVLTDGQQMASIAAWVAVTAMSEPIGNSISEAIKLKVVNALKAWRLRLGQSKLDELKQNVLQEMDNHRRNGKLTADQLRKRVDQFFNAIQD